MRKTISAIVVSLTLLFGCTGIKSVSTGLENDAFLNFIGKPSDYSKGIEVNIDDKNTFKATVNKEFVDHPKGNVYAIANGSHTITVSYEKKIIYKQQIFVSAQETKKIMLP